MDICAVIHFATCTPMSPETFVIVILNFGLTPSMSMVLFAASGLIRMLLALPVTKFTENLWINAKLGILQSKNTFSNV